MKFLYTFLALSGISNLATNHISPPNPNSPIDLCPTVDISNMNGYKLISKFSK